MRLGLVGMVCACLVAGTTSSAAPRASAWRIDAIRYATVRGFPVHELVAGADTSRTLDIAMMSWLLRGPEGRRVLVDAGSYRPKVLDSWKPEGSVRPSSGTAWAHCVQNGIGPKSC